MSANTESRFWFFFLVALFAYVAGTLSAEAGTISFVGTATLNVPDSSCAASMAAARAYLGGSWYPFNCSADPLVPGAYLMWFNASTRGLDYWAVSAISAPAPAVSLASLNAAVTALQANGSDVTILGNAIASLQSQVTALSTGHTSISTEVGRIGAVMNEPFDLPTALAGTAFFFTSVIFFYGISKGGGAVLSAIRRRH